MVFGRYTYAIYLLYIHNYLRCWVFISLPKRFVLEYWHKIIITIKTSKQRENLIE